MTANPEATALKEVRCEKGGEREREGEGAASEGVRKKVERGYESTGVGVRRCCS